VNLKAVSACTLLIIVLMTLVSPLTILQASKAEQESLNFGVTYLSTYYNYEQYYLSNKELQRDFSLFKTQGIKTITLALIWAYMEPAQGRYNKAALSNIKRVSKVAEEYDLQVILNFHTLMHEDSWTIPEWLNPRRFQTVFTNDNARAAWLGFLNNTVNSLKDISNIHSWHMMNEPYRGSWACNVSVADYLKLWSDMKAVIRLHSDKLVSIRFAEDSLSKPYHFNRDPRIYDLLDYIAINYYDMHLPENLNATVEDIHNNGKEVMISEFGYNTSDDLFRVRRSTSS